MACKQLDIDSVQHDALQGLNGPVSILQVCVALMGYHTCAQ